MSAAAILKIGEIAIVSWLHYSEKIYYDFIEPFYQINKAEFGEHVCLEFLRPP